MLTPLGKIIHMTEFVDANLYFNLVPGHAYSGILIFLNQTPIEWYCKKQSTVACATFGSKFVAAKTATKKAYSLCYSLWMMGIPVDYETYVLGDNGCNNYHSVYNPALPARKASQRSSIPLYP